MGILALIVGVVVFFLSWFPIIGIGIGLPGGVIGIILAGIGLATGGQRWAAAVGLFLSLLALVFKLIPGVNLL